jgi:hypothetical protein
VRWPDSEDSLAEIAGCRSGFSLTIRAEKKFPRGDRQL